MRSLDGEASLSVSAPADWCMLPFPNDRSIFLLNFIWTLDKPCLDRCTWLEDAIKADPTTNLPIVRTKTLGITQVMNQSTYGKINMVDENTFFIDKYLLLYIYNRICIFINRELERLLLNLSGRMPRAEKGKRYSVL